MKSIYRNPASKEKVLALYDRQLQRLPIPYHDRYVNTSFGKTHLIETGNLEGIPLLVFHGGNTTTAYNLLNCGFLFPQFHLYAVDTIGHPGKSAERTLSPFGYDYGKWTAEVIAAIGYRSIRCFGGSFGAGVLAKTMCAAPDKVERAVLYVPSGIQNAPAFQSANMLFPMLMYWLTKREDWYQRAILPMAVSLDNIDADTLETAKCSIDHVKIKVGMPSNVRLVNMRKCTAPTLVMAAEKDCLFPARFVLPRAEKLLPHCTTYLLKGRGHLNRLTAEEEQRIAAFLSV